MVTATVLRRGAIQVSDYRCSAGPADAPYVEVHQGYSVSYVRAGSFGCRTHAGTFELVAGSVLVGCPGDEYTCTHEHGFGDECMSFQLEPAVVETIGAQGDAWRTGGVPPIGELMVCWVSSPRPPSTTSATSASTRSGCCSPRASSRR